MAEEQEIKEFMEIGGSPVPGITLRQVLRGHIGTISRIAWSPDGHYLASASADKTIRIWDVEREECLKVLKGHNSRVESVAWSEDGLLAAGTRDGTIQIWNVQNYKVILSLIGHSAVVRSLAWSPDGNFLISGAGSPDRTLKLWDVKTGKLLDTSEELSGGVNEVVWSPDGKMIASGIAASIGNVLICAIRDQTELIFSKSFNFYGTTQSVQWSPNSETLASASQESNIIIYNTETDSNFILEGHTSFTEYLFFF